MDTAMIDRAIQQVPGLSENGLKVAGALHSAVLRGGEGARSVADILHGTALGHPLHAVLTDLPVGAWSFAALFDLIAGMTDTPEADWAADALVKVGLVAAVPTALAGIADYSTIPEDAAATGALHGILNSAALGLYLFSMFDRQAGRRGRGRVLGTLALGVMGAAAALGGELVYRHRVGVNHNEPVTGEGEWTAVMPLDTLGQREPHRVEVDSAPVLVFRDGDQICAIGAVCSHAGGPLDEGRFEGMCVQCPWHDSVFDLRDGGVRHGPATMAQPRYESRVRNGQVELRRADG
jgi:nitrite reductase/ring-hydroxylating ferredoxin subunit/uncharacterized membrane protein